MNRLPQDNEKIIWITLPLDEETAERLLALSNACHSEPVKVAASLLHDVLKDDEDAHPLEMLPTVGATFN